MTSRDILFLSLSLAALVATGFWVWLLWYIIRIFKDIKGLIDDFRQRLSTIDEILQTIKDKLTSTHVQLSFLAKGVTELLSFFNNQRAKRAKSSKRASANEDDV